VERLVKQALRWIGAASLAALAAACSSDPSSPEVGPPTAEVNLAVGQYVLLRDTAVEGPVRFVAAGPLGAEYLVIGQLATGSADASSSFQLGGSAAEAMASLRAGMQGRAPRPADRFHTLLRTREADFARQGRLAGALRAPAVRIPAAPPNVGDKRTFKVCGNLNCSTLKNTPATARFVGSHLAIFVDDSTPTGGFSSGDLAALGQLFDDELAPIAEARFGTESDIDTNGVVIVLLTPRVNALVPEPDCEESFVTGFFFGADIAPGFAAQYNNGEIFYGMVPDTGGVAGCAYTKVEVQRILPITFIHEFQHMISFNQKVLVRATEAEVLWLNEALSHISEELAGLHFDSLGQDTTASRYLIGNLYNAYAYLLEPDAHALVSEESPGSLEMRGGAWLFVRYLVDRFGESITNSLVQSSAVGALNVQAATGQPFEEVLGRWALATYVSDLPGFTAPADLKFDFWRLHAVYESLHDQDPSNFPVPFPLRPDSGLGSDIAVTGTLHAGSGAYLKVRQNADGGAFDLLFRQSNGNLLPALTAPQIAVVRLR
jgi:hypothetical protein